MNPSAEGAAPGGEARREVALRAGYHSPQVEVDVRLNTNESAEPPPAAFVEALVDELRAIPINRYPDREATALRSALANHHGVRTEQVFCANGSNEAIQCLLLAYGGPGRPVMAFEPTYALHSHIARLTGSPVVEGRRDEAFRVDPAELARTVGVAAGLYGAAAPAVTFLCSPNNPTGGLETPESIEAALERVPGIVAVDEAYGQFAPWSALELVTSEPRLVVLRTFSKTWAMAGLRLGYAIADPDVIASMSNVALPYHLDALKQAAGRVALRFGDEMRARVAAIIEERGRVAADLSELGLEVWPSDSNFILFRTGSKDGSAVWQGLLEHSVLIRDVSGWPGLDGCLRVTIGTPSENDRFLSALRSVLSDQPKRPWM
ncbi:MAG: histidinol-phosphate transaminase [Acidimicrobiales bacterium]|jgi:histidinol-phosphate aminotransferase